MTPENTQKLYSAFPRLYREKDKSPQESPMYWGFQCDDGWFDLIRKLSADIEHAARNEGRNPSSEDWPEATQVKQKWGTLRFHVGDASDEIRNLIAEAEKASKTICEICGAPGSTDYNNRRNVKTVCPGHPLDPPKQPDPARIPVWKFFKD